MSAARPSGARPEIAVIGGGITGLAAAYEARQRGADVTLYEATGHLGGKIETSPFAGMALDAGPDAFLARVPYATDLCRELGLGDDLVAPAARTAYVWACGELRRFPEHLLLGVPTDLAALATTGVVSPEGVARAAEDLSRPADGPPPGVDESVGDLIRRRLGHEVLDALIDPLLSGVFAGDTDRLSLLAGAPQIAAAARSGASLIEGARAQLAAATASPDAPVFLTVVGGLSRLTDKLVEAIGPEHIRRGSRVESLDRHAGGRYRLTGDGIDHNVDGVVVTTQAPIAAALVGGLAPEAAAILAAIEYASVALVSFAYRETDVARPLDASGFLVPRPAGLLMTACSWASSKFAHYGGDGIVRLRTSAGRWGDRRFEAMSAEQLVRVLQADLKTTMGISAEPLEVRVSPWPASLPQYTVGHLDRLAQAEADLASPAAGPGLAVTGAAFRGVGLPACINQGRTAAHTVITRLG